MNSVELNSSGGRRGRRGLAVVLLLIITVVVAVVVVVVVVIVAGKLSISRVTSSSSAFPDTWRAITAVGPGGGGGCIQAAVLRLHFLPGSCQVRTLSHTG